MKSSITVLALMLLAPASADSSMKNAEPVRVLEQHYYDIIGKHDKGSIIDRELRECSLNTGSATECALGVVKKHGGEELDMDVLAQLQSLGHFVEDSKNTCHSDDMSCHRHMTEVVLPQIMSMAQSVLQSIAKDPHAARLKEVKELSTIFTEIQNRLADSEKGEGSKNDSMRDRSKVW